MKIGVILLLLFVSSTYSFQCDSVLYGRRCGEFDRASKALKKVVEKTDDAIDDVYDFLGTESAKLYATIFEKFGDNATIIVKGNMTKDEAMALLDKMFKLLKEMTLIGKAAKKDLEKIQDIIKEALKKSLVTDGTAYLILDKLDLQELKEYIRNKLTGVGSIARALIINAVDKAHGRIQDIGKYLEPIMRAAGLGDVYDKIKAKIQELVDRAKTRVGGYITDIEQQVAEANKDVDSFIESFKDGAIVKRGLDDLWNKVEAALDKLGDNVKVSAKELLEKYKPKVLAALDKVKKIVINGTKTLIVQLKNDLVQILSTEKKVKRSLSDRWNQLKAAVKNLAVDVQDTVNKIIDANKPVIEKALEDLKKVVIDGAKKVVIQISDNIVKVLVGDNAEASSAKISPYVIIDQSKVQSTYAFKDIWNKLKAKVNDLGSKLKDKSKILIEKYKPIILKTLKEVKQFVIEEGQKIVIELKGDIIKVIVKELITDATSGTTPNSISKRSIADYWNKIKETAKKLGSDIRDQVSKVIDEHKDKVISALDNVKKVVIDGAKKIVITINNGIVKVLTDGQTATSDDSLYAFDDAEYTTYVVIDDSTPSTYGFQDIWGKVTKAVKDLKDKISVKAKELIEKYKVVISDSLNRVKEFVIDEGKKIVIKLKGDLVEIIETSTDELKKGIQKRSISDYWDKIKETAKKLGSDIRDQVSKVIDDHKDKVISALENVKKVVIDGAKKIVITINNGIVKVLTDGQTATSDDSLYMFDNIHYTTYVVIDDSTPSTYGFKDIMAKVKQTVDSLKGKLSLKAKALIEKYKDVIGNSLNKVKHVIIEEGKKIIIMLKGDVVEIIETTTDEIKKGITKRGITDYWTKVKETIKKLGSNIRDEVNKVVDAHKDKVIAALHNVKKVVIDGAKKVIITVQEGIVKVLTDGQTATSEDSLYAFDDAEYTTYVVIDDSTPSTYGFQDIWAKVTKAVTDLKDKISVKAKELIEKYKVVISDSLNKVKEFVIDEGKKIVIKLKGDLVEIIETSTDELKKGIQKRSISDYWNKIKETAKKLGSDIRDQVSKVIDDHKDKVISALENVKKVVIDGAKKIVITINNGIVKVLTDGQTATSDDSLYMFDNIHYTTYVVIDDATPSTYGFKDILAKVKQTVDSLKGKLSLKAKALIEKYKDVIGNSLNKVKHVIIEEGKKIIIMLKGDVVEIIETTTDEIKKGITKRGITDYWTKVKETIKKLGSNIRDEVNKVVDAHKDKVIAALHNVKKVVIDGAKKVIITVQEGIVKVLTDGQTATSEDSLYAFDDAEYSTYVVIDDSTPSTYGFQDIWAKVTKAVTDLKDKISVKAKELIEKYKVVISDSLNKVKEFVIDEGKKIVIKLKGDLVEIIETSTDELKKGIQKRSISDYWNKIKETAKKLGSDIRDQVSKVIDEHKDKVISALDNVKKVVIDGVKQIVITINKGVVKILTDGQTATSDDSIYNFDNVQYTTYVVIDNSTPSTYGFTDILGKLKRTVDSLKGKLSLKAKLLIEKYKMVIANSLNKVKQVIIEEGKKIVIMLKGDVVEIIETTIDEVKGSY